MEVTTVSSTVNYEVLLEQDQKQLHGLHHPNRHKDPLIVERADGVWLYSADGRKVLDAMAGLWNVNIGYGNQELPEAAWEQMRKLAYTSGFAGMSNPPSIELAEKLAGYAHPTLNTTYFTAGGSESNETAFKTARYYWRRLGKPEKSKIVSRYNAYHGITMAAASATGMERYWKMFGLPLPGFVHAPAPNPFRYKGDLREGESIGQAAARALEEMIVREGPESVAAFIAEPIQGAGGVIVPPADYFPLVRAICDKHDVLLILDEVITGFGRSGKLFGQHHWEARPDIMAFAKGVTSGYLPLGGIQISDAIREVILSAPEDEAWMHGFTYSGHAAACAVGIKNIEIIEREKLVERSQQMGERLRKGLESLAEEFGIAANVRGKGLLCGMEVVKDRESLEPDDETAAIVSDLAMARGLRARPLGNVLAFSPPLSIREEEVDLIVEILGSAFDSIQR
jgi:adenosylmethionine-8-amino-7-oxononanoate aminotransferase